MFLMSRAKISHQCGVDRFSRHLGILELTIQQRNFRGEAIQINYLKTENDNFR